MRPWILAAWLVTTPPPALVSPPAEVDAARFRVQIDGRWGFIDATGRLAIPASFDHVGLMEDGRAPFEAGVIIDGDRHDHTRATWGFIDANGAVIVPPRYLAAKAFSEGRAAVKCPDGRWGFVDVAGAEVIPCAFARPGSFHDGRASVELLGRSRDAMAFVDPAGRIVFELPPDVRISEAPVFSEGIAVLDIGEGSRAVDESGRALWEVPWSVRDFTAGYAPYRDGERWGLLAMNGKPALLATWEGVGPVVDGVAPVRVGDLWGTVDLRGEFVVKPRFTRLYTASEGLAWASEGADFGYVDRAGAWVIPPVWKDPENAACRFRDGLALVESTDGVELWIDRQGRKVWPR